MTLISAVQGAVTQSTARIIARVTGSATRVLYSTSESFTSPVYTDVATPLSGVASFVLTGLLPNTRYYWAVEDDAVLDTVSTGQFLTHPVVGEPANFVIAASSCAGLTPEYPGVGAVMAANRLSNSPVFSIIKDMQPLVFNNMGDIAYYDTGSGVYTPDASVATYRTMYDDVFAQPEQASLYRQVPLDYVWDDHDFGPNNSDRTSPGNANINQVYRERIPSYGLPETAGCYHTYQIGRVQFIVLDTRTFRDPNTDPDVPGKTMLGTAQKAWLTDVLTNSTAQLFIIITPSVWMHPDGPDTWFAFQNERDELISLFESTNTIDKLIMMWGDRHAIGIDSGANMPGGMLGIQFAALDSAPSGPALDRFDQGTEISQYGQFGTLSFVDDGSRITVTATGYVMDSPVITYTKAFVTEDESPVIPTIPVPPVVPAFFEDGITWHAADLVTGVSYMELPEVTGEPSKVIGGQMSTALTVHMAAIPGLAAKREAITATKPFRTMIVAVANNTPVWAGVPIERKRGSYDDMTLACITVDGYLFRRFITEDIEFPGNDEAYVMSTLVSRFAGDILGVGKGISFAIDAEPTGRLTKRSYKASEKTSVGTALTEIMAEEDGAEWTTSVVWTDPSRNSFTHVFTVKPEIGDQSLVSDIRFETATESVSGVPDVSFEVVESYSADDGATVLGMTLPGEGNAKPLSRIVYATEDLATGAPVWESYQQASDTVLTQEQLDGVAEETMFRIHDGVTTLTVETQFHTSGFGLTYHLGDLVRYHFVSQTFPDGLDGTARVMGWNLDTKTLIFKPLLWTPDGFSV